MLIMNYHLLQHQNDLMKFFLLNKNIFSLDSTIKTAKLEIFFCIQSHKKGMNIHYFFILWVIDIILPQKYEVNGYS